MNSKKIFSWSKRQSGSESYYRTGGIVPIDASPDLSSNGFEAKATPKTRRKPPSQLTIFSTEEKPFLQSPHSATHVVNALSTLQTPFSDMLLSPAACSRPTSISQAPPSPSLSVFLSSPDLPAELPGSILQDNHGFPTCTVAEDLAIVRPASQNSRRSTGPPIRDVDYEDNFATLITLFPEPIIHSKSVPDLGQQFREMRSVRSSAALSTSTVPKPSPLGTQHEKPRSATSSKRSSKTDPVKSPMSVDGKLAVYSTPTVGHNSARARPLANQTLHPELLNPGDQVWNDNAENRKIRRSELTSATTPTPTTTRSKQIEELKGTIATQDQTITTLQTQFASLRASHESHITSLAGTHSAEVASLRNYARVLEEQLAQRPSLHHASSNNLLFRLDTTEPQTPSRENSQHTAESSNTNSSSFAQNAQHLSPKKAPDSPEMENLKRKLSSTRRPETTSRSLLPELNQYKQNNVALQKQIESLMAKLNESKQSERALRTSLDEMIQQSSEWQEKSEQASKAERSVQALQNTINHLENRLEIANIERLDAEEQLFLIQAQKSPFDFHLSGLQVPSGTNHHPVKAAHIAHLSMGTVFSSSSPLSPEHESQELSTLAAFISHIEGLQDQVQQKDAQILELEKEREQFRKKQEHFEQEQSAMTLQMDVQNKLLMRTRRTDANTEELRAAIMDREAIISEKEKSIRDIGRQLEHYKLLLQAQIRRYATMTLHAAATDDALPDLNTITARADVDTWVERLHERLEKEKSSSSGRMPLDPKEAQIVNLRREIDFYVREIIYYKLDIRGYKSDIKKLKRGTAQLSNHGSRASPESEASSFRPSATPNGFSGAVDRPLTPPPSGSTVASNNSRVASNRVPRHLDLNFSTAPPTPSDGNEARYIQTDTASHSDVRHSERRRPTPPPLEFGDLLTELPIKTHPEPHAHVRSFSESVIPVDARNEATVASLESSHDGPKTPTAISRSASVSESSKGRVTPDRPPRPRYGLFESPKSKARRTAIFNPLGSPFKERPIGAENRSAVPEPARQPARQPSSLSRNNSTASSVRATPYGALELQDRATNSPSPASPAILRSRTGSVTSTTGHISTQLPSPPERKLSAASSSSIPFVISMGSPHNPALVSPISSMSPTSARLPPLVTSLIGVGGTMASSTPISPTDTSLDAPLRPIATKPIALAQSRKLSFSRKYTEDQGPRTPSHSRSGSAGSIRTAIRLPKREEAQRVRKESIGVPRMLESPFGVEEEGVRYGVGEAI